MKSSPVLQTDGEIEFVASLLEAAHESGFCVNETAFVNFYVALKAKPMLILTGPEGSGKIAAVQCLSRILLGSSAQCQVVVGHPWTFGGSENLALFTEIHTRYNTEKLLCLIEEAWRPENVSRPFIACLTRISPAELLSFFTEVASQLRLGQLMRLGDIHFSEPIPFPPNLFVIGTMDTPVFNWWDHDLLSKTSVVQWPAFGTLASAAKNGNGPLWEGELLRSCVRHKQAVYHKVHSILKRQKQPLEPLLQIEALLREHAIPNLDWLIDEVMRYLANAWSKIGNGLFSSSPVENLKIALDLAIAQILLPLTVDVIRKNVTLRERLVAIVTNQLPRSADTVAAVAALG